jgi:hypothetical protein
MSALKNLAVAAISAIVASLGTSSAVYAFAIFLSTSAGEIGTVNNTTGVFTLLGSGSTVFGDIALSQTNSLVGVTVLSNGYYTINPSTGASTSAGNIGQVLNGLGFSSTGALFGTGGNKFYSLDPTNGATTQVGGSISGFNSAGDIVFDAANNRFLATSTAANSTTLFSITTAGVATQIGDIGFANVYGLAFEGGTLFGYTDDRRLLTINPASGSGTFLRNITGTTAQIYGVASQPVEVPIPSQAAGALIFGAISAWKLRFGKRKAQSKIDL